MPITSTIKLGRPVKDAMTGMIGILTHVQIYGNGNTFYLLQPKGIIKATGKVLPTFWITSDRMVKAVVGKTTHNIESTNENLPLEIIGTKVTVPNYGFKGVVASIEKHINGCIHAYIQPLGSQDNGERFEQRDFDLRELSGVAIRKLSEKKKEESKRTTPSPAHAATHRHN